MNENTETKTPTAGPDTKPLTAWQKVKKAADENRTIAGAVGGFAAGTVVPGVGNVVGAIVGAGVGYFSSREKAKQEVTRSTEGKET